MASPFYWQLLVPAALRALAPFNLFVRPQMTDCENPQKGAE